MEFAEAMHSTPWDVFGGRKILWWYRWKTRRDLMLAKLEKGND